MSNFLVYPFKVMRITQSYNGLTSHLPHNSGTPKDWPIDEGAADAGRDWCFCPCDEMKVVRIYGVGNSGVNTVWLTSTGKCDLANGERAVVTMLLTHPNDDDLRKLKVGQRFRRGEKICREGKDGASGNHIHLSLGKGSMTGTGWTKNSRGKWVLTTSEGTVRPENAFYLYKPFTKALDMKKLGFKVLSAATSKRYQTTAELCIRAGAGTDCAVAGAYKKGTKIKVTRLVTAGTEKWGYTGKGWVALRYCEEL